MTLKEAFTYTVGFVVLLVGVVWLVLYWGREPSCKPEPGNAMPWLEYRPCPPPPPAPR